MAFDGIFTGKIAKELSVALDSHIDKIYQPSNSELCLVLRKKGFLKRLIISVKNGEQRVHFTNTKLENPEKPPMFCMLFRKYFSAARLLSVTQKGFERLVEFEFETTNEMGDRVNRRVICELIGNMNNIVLVDESGRITDALKRSDITAARRIMPGAVYEYPVPQEKLDIYKSQTDEITDKIISFGELCLSRAILNSIGGISPLTAREMIFRAGLEDLPVCEIKDISALKSEIAEFKGKLSEESEPCLILKDGRPFDFCYTNIKQYNGFCDLKNFETLSELLDAFYEERERASVKSRISGELQNKVNTLILRAQKRMSGRQNELLLCEKREELRINGELIKANIGVIKAGQKSVRVQNFYDENLCETEIELDEALSPAANAAKYFKEYKKKNTAAVTLKGFIDDDLKEIEYLNSVAESITRCETAADVAEIKEELIKEGYIKNSGGKKSIKQKAAVFKEYKSREGYKIAVGKNNSQNDMLTLHIASKNDMWFHTKNIHGSHVVVFSGGKSLSEETILFAARLAAKNSKASNSSNVPVDYTLIKYVKKPAGAKAGMVIYTDNKTVFVTPESE